MGLSREPPHTTGLVAKVALTPGRPEQSRSYICAATKRWRARLTVAAFPAVSRPVGATRTSAARIRGWPSESATLSGARRLQDKAVAPSAAAGSFTARCLRPSLLHEAALAVVTNASTTSSLPEANDVTSLTRACAEQSGRLIPRYGLASRDMSPVTQSAPASPCRPRTSAARTGAFLATVRVFLTSGGGRRTR